MASRNRDRALHNWRRVVLGAISAPPPSSSSQSSRFGSVLPNAVPASLAQASNIDTILQVANEIQAEDPNVSRILCEHAYDLSQYLDPNSAGRGVLQFKTGLQSILKQKLAKKDGAEFNRSQDIEYLRKFYTRYRQKHDVKALQESPFTWDRMDETMLTKRRVFTTLRVLKDVVDALLKKVSSSEAAALLPSDVKMEMESDAVHSKQLKPSNIIPLDVSDNATLLPEVRGAVAELEYADLPPFPRGFKDNERRRLDLFDALGYIFGFQTDNVRNQREHLVLLLANCQTRLGPIGQQLDEKAVNEVHDKILDNYKKWCSYLRKPRIRGDTKKKKLLFVSLYLLIWGEAANVRFLPECLCYIFHHMAGELEQMMQNQRIQQAESCSQAGGDPSFLKHIISPIYLALRAEADKNHGGKAGHSKWRNYDDFNEFFWSASCFKKLGGLPWNTNSAFFSGAITSSEGTEKTQKAKRSFGKTSFVEHRTFFHLYHSFPRVWILLVMMFQGLTIVAFSRSWNLQLLKILLSLGLTFFVMKLIESVLDVILMYGAYKSSRENAISRIFGHLAFFGGCAGGLFYLYLKLMQDDPNSVFLKIYGLALGIYAAVQLIISFVMHIPALRRWLESCSNFGFGEWVTWLYEERYYVGRGLFEKPRDYVRYVAFWAVVLGCKFTFSYFFQIKPLVDATRTIVNVTGQIDYKWHDFFSKNNHNALAVFFLWAPVALIYILDISIWYTVFSAILGGLIGARERLGEIRSLEMFRNRFDTYPKAFVDTLQFERTTEGIGETDAQDTLKKQKEEAGKFAPFWNEIITCLRAEDYITNREKDLLLMPSNRGKLPLVQWPLFLLVSKVYLAIDLANETKETPTELWEKMGKDQYMLCAVNEAYESLCEILTDLVNDEDKSWVNRVIYTVQNSLSLGSFHANFDIHKIQNVLTRVTALTGLLVKDRTDDLEKGVRASLKDLYNSIDNFLMFDSQDANEQERAKWIASFRTVNWPSSSEQKESIKRLHSLLFIKESAASIPKNLEAQRRLQFFTNSLFMKIPKAPSAKAMVPFCVYTPYYSETVLYSKEELRKENEDGISTLFYLQKIFPDEWRNFLERIGLTEHTFESQLESNKLDPSYLVGLRLWASYRGQTLARTVRGMMYYRRAVMLQSYLETEGSRGSSERFERSLLARSQADLKFTYVVTCQIYGQQKAKQEAKAADILYLMQQYEGLRIAFIDTTDNPDPKIEKEYYSKLVKGDGTGKDQEIYSIKLPGNPIIGEGKPENQNHAIIFTRGEAVQTIDMNQDNYLEEALKMRNLLEEFGREHELRPPTILGVREHVFTGSVSSLASFMSNQETSFVTLGQRVLASPLKVRMHYGHPDVFDRIFHFTRGGISKASKVINISEDIYAGFNSTLRQGNVTHHEYIQVGKGRDVGLNQIALFEAKVSSGNGEQSLSRDIYRLGQLLDFFRMLSFFVTSVGYYVCTMMTVLVVYAFLYGKAYLALSGVGESLESLAIITRNKALQSALDTQFLFQIGMFTAIPMLVVFILEQGVLKAIMSFVIMQLQLCSVFFTFSLGTRTHYFGRTVLHGGAKYRATGRGFVVQHIKFADNYRMYSRSHFVKALEIMMLLLVYLAYGYDNSSISYILLSFSSWFLALSWLFAPYVFNPSGFEWQKTVDDFDDWSSWLLYRGGVGVKGENSWEAWWEEEQEHIRSIRGRILETILSIRFFLFQFGVVYHLKAANGSTSLGVYGVSWVVLIGIILIFKVFSFSQKASVNFQMFIRLLQGMVFLLLIGGLIAIVALTSLTVGDVFASLLAFIPTGWGILSIGIAWKSVVKQLGLWRSFRAIARVYDAAMGVVIFFPIAVLSWFPFVSTFQTRLLFNQAFSRGLEISLILAGNRPNVQV